MSDSLFSTEEQQTTFFVLREDHEHMTMEHLKSLPEEERDGLIAYALLKYQRNGVMPFGLPPQPPGMFQKKKEGKQ